MQEGAAPESPVTPEDTASAHDGRQAAASYLAFLKKPSALLSSVTFSSVLSPLGAACVLQQHHTPGQLSAALTGSPCSLPLLTQDSCSYSPPEGVAQLRPPGLWPQPLTGTRQGSKCKERTRDWGEAMLEAPEL